VYPAVMKPLLRDDVKPEDFEEIKSIWQQHHYYHGNCATARCLMAVMVAQLAPYRPRADPKEKFKC